MTKKKQMGDSPKERNLGPFLFFGSILTLFSLFSFACSEFSKSWLGVAGYAIGWMFTAFFGIPSYLLVVYFAWWGLRKWRNKSLNAMGAKHFHCVLLILSLAFLLSVVEAHFPLITDHLGSFFYAQPWQQKLHFHLGGALAFYLYQDLPRLNLQTLISPLGVSVVFFTTFLISFLYLTKIHVRDVFKAFGWCYRQLAVPFRSLKQTNREAKPLPAKVPARVEKFTDVAPVVKMQAPLPSSASPIEAEIAIYKQPSLPSKKELRERAIEAQKVYNGDYKAYKIPKCDLLTNPKIVDQSELETDLKNLAEILEETLLSFGIEAKVGQINCGPTITSFEVHPAIGVKVQKIKALESDIALNMKAKSIRILAPIPGKAAIGIEVPNPKPQEVSFKEILMLYQQNEKKLHIPVLLGKKVNGDCVIEDMARMPHLIIAGATGSGKSVCINTIVMSILMNCKPDEVKLIMVDPKKVELNAYSKLPHMLAPVITEPTGACAALNWLVKEMETRYELLKIVGFRNIAAFNKREIDREFEEGVGREIPERLPYIVCIIDELADLMMVASNEIETYIARIAQMARAVGIHLILATQRPSREVITGLIKANFPTRIAFKVSSRINSQIILDEVGAETLLGWGDMLFLPPGAHNLVRAQGAFLSDKDIHKVIHAIGAQAPPNYAIESFDDVEALKNSLGEDADHSEKDALYDEALDTILSTGNASTTFLQRKLKIGYARAASIIDQLENNRVLGPQEGSKARKILVPLEIDQ